MSEKLTEIFGIDVFNETKMRERLPKTAFTALKQVIEKGGDLTLDTANVIEMYRMFNECGVLQSITVNSSFIQKAAETGSYEMYRLCPAQIING